MFDNDEKADALEFMNDLIEDCMNGDATITDRRDERFLLRVLSKNKDISVIMEDIADNWARDYATDTDNMYSMPDTLEKLLKKDLESAFDEMVKKDALHVVFTDDEDRPVLDCYAKRDVAKELFAIQKIICETGTGRGCYLFSEDGDDYLPF